MVNSGMRHVHPPAVIDLSAKNMFFGHMTECCCITLVLKFYWSFPTLNQDLIFKAHLTPSAQQEL